MQSIQRSLNLLFQRTPFLIFPLSQKYLNTQVKTNKLVNSVIYHPRPSRLAPLPPPFPLARPKRWRKLWFALSKFNQRIRKRLGTLVYMYFVCFVIFLNVMALQCCKYLSNSVVLILLTLVLCNHGNLTQTFHQKR